jgi:hypothetical protein
MERGPYSRVFHPMERGHEKALQMRILAARLRSQAAETSLEIFQEKFRATAAELEKAALTAESRTHFLSVIPGMGSGPEYRH